MNFTAKKTLNEGRTSITVEATPKSPQTRVLLREFHAAVRELEKNWKATVKAHAAARKAEEAGGAKPAKSAKTTKPVKAAKPVKATKPAKTAKPVKPTKQTKPVKRGR